MVKLALQPQEQKLTIKHPATKDEVLAYDEDGEPIKFVLHIVSPYSTQFRDVVKQMSSQTDKDNYQHVVKLAAACIVGWDETKFVDSPYSPEVVNEIFEDAQNMWIAEQVVSFVDNLENFFTVPNKG